MKMRTKEKEENNIQFLSSQIVEGCIECGKAAVTVAICSNSV